MGTAGRLMVEELFSSEKVLAQISAVYRKALLKGN